MAIQNKKPKEKKTVGRERIIKSFLTDTILSNLVMFLCKLEDGNHFRVKLKEEVQMGTYPFFSASSSEATFSITRDTVD